MLRTDCRVKGGHRELSREIGALIQAGDDGVCDDVNDVKQREDRKLPAKFLA